IPLRLIAAIRLSHSWTVELDRAIQSKGKASTPKWHTRQPTLRVCVFSSRRPPRRHGSLGESRAIRDEHRSHATAAARRTHPARSNVDAADAQTSDDGCRPDPALQPAQPRLCGFSATPRGDLYALELKASTAAARLVEFQVAVKGFGLQTLDLARLCH